MIGSIGESVRLKLLAGVHAGNVTALAVVGAAVGVAVAHEMAEYAADANGVVVIGIGGCYLFGREAGSPLELVRVPRGPWERIQGVG